MLTCIFALHRDRTTTDRSLQWTLQVHIKERPSVQNPSEGKVETVTDRVKPARIEREPGPGTTQKRQMQPRSLPTSKPAAIARKPRTARARSRSTITPQPLKTGVSLSRTTNTQSPTLGVGSGPAIAARSNTIGARLPSPPTLYKAPHTRTNITSRAYGENGNRRTYSRVPYAFEKIRY